MEDNYSKAYREVIEILNYVPIKSVNKIPQALIDTFKTKMDKNYNFSIAINKSFEDQHLLEETKAIFANIFRDYWATPYQKEKIEAKEKYDRQKIKEEKIVKYNPNDIFKKKNKEINIENLLIEVKKENFYTRLINFIKKVFKL